jgi:(p)ppGpp synthase/HD superfamily hydrolase
MRGWVEAEPTLAKAYRLAERAHGASRRPSDGRTFLAHVTEVSDLLREGGFDADLIAVGLLHDSVERGTLTRAELEAEMGEPICSLVMALSEDPSIEVFEARKSALRSQVVNAGGRALTVFAADKLSDVRGLRRGLRTSGRAEMERRLDAGVADMAEHYRESVALIEVNSPGSTFLPALRRELDGLQMDVRAAALSA